jgi:hypothetical protein
MQIDDISKETKKFDEEGYRQVRLRNQTYSEIVQLGCIPESIDSVVARALKYAKPMMREYQAKVYSDLANAETARQQ